MPRLTPTAGLCAAILVLAPPAAFAQRDTTALFTSSDLWIGLGFTAATAAALPLDQVVAHDMQLPQNQREPGLIRASTVFRDMADPGTIFVSLGLYGAGIVLQNPVAADIGLHTTESLVIASTAGFLLKGIVGRPLPRQHDADADSYHFGRGIRDDGNWQSFPSGHTLAAFAVASALPAETNDRWPADAGVVGILTYSAAAGAGISRLYNNAHWVSDIIFGAGIGVLSGRATVRYEHSHRGDWLNRVLLDAVVAPQSHHSTLVGLHWSVPTVAR
ncbi:MAG: phosphatase PAP2 family protein [Gemmatimonadaceae bacterium]